ncbi:MAG: ATP-binding protein [Deltaproteobacteria bacterium]|nr:ATP-binding protein [Deltaproteobacteria bacterium]
MNNAANGSNSGPEEGTRPSIPAWLFAVLISIIAIWCLSLVKMIHHARLDWHRNVDLLSSLQVIGSDIEKLSFQDEALTPGSVRSLSHRFLATTRSVGVEHPDLEALQSEVRSSLRDAMVTLELVAHDNVIWPEVKEHVQGLNRRVNALLALLRAQDDRLSAKLESETRSFYVLGAVSTGLTILNLIFLVAYRRRQDKITQALLARRRMQNLLLVAERMASVGTLAAGVGHEINNPLAYVIVNLDLLLPLAQKADANRSLATSEANEMVELVTEIREGAIRIRDIVADLKSFSRTEPTPIGPVDVARVLDLCTRMASVEIRHRASVVRKIGDLPKVRAEEGRLAQVFLNLLVNAAQSIREGNVAENEIRISSRQEGNRVLVDIQDTGGGISPEILERIFDPFFTTKPVGQGTGLGLAFCHSTVQQMGGAISVVSEPGQGSTFTVSLPIYVGDENPVALAAADGPPKLAHAGMRGRILVVDDEPLVAKTIKRLLSANHDVEILPGSRSTLSMFAEGRTDWDVILLDLTMPEMSGIDLHKVIVETYPSLAPAIVFVSGGVFTAAAQDYLAQNTVPLLTKPFDSAELHRTIEDRVRSRSQISTAPRRLPTKQVSG